MLLAPKLQIALLLKTNQC
uniref:Uncharacterized protein n=1 Tax=Anguilla anguilla TaxID=7936 RepID=A0A0E9QE28_ANGAN